MTFLITNRPRLRMCIFVIQVLHPDIKPILYHNKTRRTSDRLENIVIGGLNTHTHHVMTYSVKPVLLDLTACTHGRDANVK